MKKIIITLLASIPVLAFAQKTDCIISGTLKNIKDSIPYVYFTYSNEGKDVRDSALVKDNRYAYKANIHEPMFMYVAGRPAYVRSSHKFIASVFVEPGKMNIVSTDSFSNIKVSGSKAHADYERLTNSVKPYEEKMQEISKDYIKHRQQNDETLMKEDEKKFDSLNEKRQDVFGDFAKNNPNSPVALFALGQYAGYSGLDVAKIEPVFNKLSNATKNSYSGKAFAKRIEAAKSTGIGAMAPNFTQNDTLGNPVSLASFKGKYVLLDFWASWCGPCREENPNVVAAYNKYKGKNFTILSVSLDREGQKDRWIEAIHHDGLAWTHVSDLKYWYNAVAQQYGVQSIPQNYLLDPTGKIIAKDLRGEDLEKKLQELLD
ncbi:MAG: redoxin domain-containing protein [Chitinophagaceae bacterium]|jgi:peroxiredoxin|nr:redoxin domain-containing protein [Chitinophagaceae bacterium]